MTIIDNISEATGCRDHTVRPAQQGSERNWTAAHRFRKIMAMESDDLDQWIAWLLNEVKRRLIQQFREGR